MQCKFLEGSNWTSFSTGINIMTHTFLFRSEVGQSNPSTWAGWRKCVSNCQEGILHSQWGRNLAVSHPPGPRTGWYLNFRAKYLRKISYLCLSWLCHSWFKWQFWMTLRQPTLRVPWEQKSRATKWVPTHRTSREIEMGKKYPVDLKAAMWTPSSKASKWAPNW